MRQGWKHDGAPGSERRISADGRFKIRRPVGDIAGREGYELHDMASNTPPAPPTRHASIDAAMDYAEGQGVSLDPPECQVNGHEGCTTSEMRGQGTIDPSDHVTHMVTITWPKEAADTNEPIECCLGCASNYAEAYVGQGYDIEVRGLDR